MNENGVIHSSLIRPIEKLLVPKDKSQFQLLDDPDSDNYIDYIMLREKISIYDGKLLFRDTGVVFTSKRDILSMIMDYVFNKTDSPDAKQIFIFFGRNAF